MVVLGMKTVRFTTGNPVTESVTTPDTEPVWPKLLGSVTAINRQSSRIIFFMSAMRVSVR